MRKRAFPPAIRRDSPERDFGPASPDALSRFVIAREKLRKRAPKVMKSLKRVNLCEGASALVPAATSQALRANFHFLVNQTFRKPRTHERETLTRISHFSS